VHECVGMLLNTVGSDGEISGGGCADGGHPDSVLLKLVLRVTSVFVAIAIIIVLRVSLDVCRYFVWFKANSYL